ncbi:MULTISPECIES: hypothetical protein [Kitasatospora]|uniref:Uncharacterized protein n=2 Tax=Kitasatospora TaxID=2063 RepID=A0ABT1IQ04_9ACTN|nr:hypothetical protein [Kitasatospora paracochleata]MCP2307202.1 hypothetical protein [Kitasatospora paracochleata]
MVHLIGQITPGFRPGGAPGPLRRVRARAGLPDAPVRVPAVRREPTASETGELLITHGADGRAATIQWQRPGGPAIRLEPPYRLDRVDLKGSYRARLHGLTAGIRLVCRDHSPLFLIAPRQLPVLALAAATSRTTLP